MARTVGNVTINDAVLKNIMRTAPGKVIEGLDAMAFDGERDVKQSFGTSVSDPGDPPGVDTGTLRSSIHTENTGRFSRAITTGVDYAAHLEYGTSKMAARPFMMPMAMRLQKRSHQYFSDIAS